MRRHFTHILWFGLLGLLLVLGLGGCKGRGQIQNSQKLALQSGNEQYWLLSLVPEKADPYLPYSLCLMFRLRKQDSLQFVDVFCNQRHFAPIANLGLKLTQSPKLAALPLKLEAEGNGQSFFWFLDKNHLWLKLSKYDRQGLELKGKLVGAKNWEIFNLQAEASVWSTQVAQLVDGEKSYRMILSSFLHAEDLTSQFQAAASYWIDLSGEQGERLSLIGQLDEAGNWTNQSLHAHKLDFPTAALQFERLAIPTQYAHYLSHFRLGNAQTQWEIQPTSWDSEVNLKQSSFWMGPIEAIPTSGGQSLKGTMLIFNKRR